MAPLQFLSLHLKIGFCLPESLIPLFQYWLLRSSQQGPPHFGHTTVVVLMVLCSWCCAHGVAVGDHPIFNAWLCRYASHPVSRIKIHSQLGHIALRQMP